MAARSGVSITGAHAIIFSRHSDQLREFFRDVIGFRSVDAGDGWLIFALPPAELAVHPAHGRASHELFLMCDNIERTVARLRTKGASFKGKIQDAGWGRLATLKLPDGAAMGLYEPRHASPLKAAKKRTRAPRARHSVRR